MKCSGRRESDSRQIAGPRSVRPERARDLSEIAWVCAAAQLGCGKLDKRRPQNVASVDVPRIIREDQTDE